MSSHVCKETIGFYETSFKLVIEALIGVHALPLKCKRRVIQGQDKEWYF